MSHTESIEIVHTDPTQLTLLDLMGLERHAILQNPLTQGTWSFAQGTWAPCTSQSNKPPPLLLDEEKHCFAGGRTSQVGSVGWNFFFLVAKMTLNTKKIGEKWTLFVEIFFEKYSDFCQTTRFWQTKKNVPTIRIWVSRTHKTGVFFHRLMHQVSVIFTSKLMVTLFDKPLRTWSVFLCVLITSPTFQHIFHNNKTQTIYFVL